MDIEGFRKAGYQAVDRICDYYASLQQQPVSAQVKPGFLEHAIPSHAPEEPEPWSLIQQEFHSKIMPGITHWQHPNFYGFFPANTTFESALADLYCASISNPGFNWACSPSVTELEIIMVDWVAKMLGLSDAFLSTSSSGTGGGVIHGSASEVTLTIAIAAREKAVRDLTVKANDAAKASSHVNGANGTSGTTSASLDSDRDVAAQVPGKTAAEVGQDATEDANSRDAKLRGDITSRLVMYGTTQTHTVGSKAALILGIAFRALEVTAEDGYGLRGDTLRAALEEDEAAGRIPFLLIATVGTTSSGAIDNLAEIVDVARSHPSLWLHVDAAYAGVALSLPELRESCHLSTINAHFDSFSTNLHKAGLVAFDCSPLWLRDRTQLSEALTVTPAYLRTAQSTHRLEQEMRNLQISLGRRFRSLKVWFVLRSYGVSGFQRHVRTCMDLCNVFTDSLRTNAASDHPLFEIVAPPRWAMVVFRLNPHPSPSADKEVDLEKLNKHFWSNLQRHNAHFVLTSTVLPQVGTCVRFVVGSPQTELRHVEETWQRIHGIAEETWDEYRSAANGSA